MIPLPPGHTRPPAPPLTDDQARTVARFDAAPLLPESSPMTRAVLALAEELDRRATQLAYSYDNDYTDGEAQATRRIAGEVRTTVAAVLAADPEPRDAVVDGAALIAAERRRQVEAEGWTPEHDAAHAGESLALAACCYAVPPQMRKYRPTGAGPVPTLWPWAPGYWKPRGDDRIRELVKAGALIAAEIDRLAAAALDASRGATQ